MRALKYFRETLRQTGILIRSSTRLIWTLVFITGLECGIDGGYFLQSQGA